MQSFYGDDINIVENAPVGGDVTTYTGVPLELGDRENNVQILQIRLNRISDNYPAIPKITDPDGTFDVETQNAVKKFQEIFSLPQTGIVDKSTWYKINRYYNGVKGLSELASEGITLEEATVPFASQIAEGSSGIDVRTLQYYLSIIAYFNSELQPVPIDGNFDSATVDAVERFQAYYGLPVTGIVDSDTWEVIDRIYTETVAALPEGYQGNNAKLYPGYFLTKGMRGENVSDLQSYLNLIGKTIPEIPEVPVTGYFGDQTDDAIRIFQQLFGIPVTGDVGPVTWYQIALQYDFLNRNN